jgi:hypothetical protein
MSKLRFRKREYCTSEIKQKSGVYEEEVNTDINPENSVQRKGLTSPFINEHQNSTSN